MHNRAVIPGKFASCRTIVLWAVCVSLFMAFNGCAWLIKPPQDQVQARQCLNNWLTLNATLTQFKGMMRVRIETQNARFNARAAFAADAPDRIRVELLNPIGQPLTSFVSDGHHISIFSTHDQKYYHLKQSPTALNRLIHIPIGVHDLIDVIRGRPALPEFYAAQLGTSENNGCDVRLKNRWNTQLVHLRSDDAHRLDSMQTYHPDGSLQYKVQWDHWRNLDQHLLPGKISVMTGGGDQVTIQLERLWADVPLDPFTFILQPPVK